MIQYRNIIRPIMITEFQSGYRLDRALSQLLPDYSRSQIKLWILQGKVKLNNFIVSIPKKKVRVGELIEIYDTHKNIRFFGAQNIPLNIVYEDDYILVINKPFNFVVHPGAGNFSGTLFNSLLYHYPSISSVPRAGIVHRLDKDTTGLMIVAKDIFTRIKLIELIQSRKIIREYEAIIFGNLVHNKGTINAPIARHVVNRTCMAVSLFGKSAITHYQVLEDFFHWTRVKLRLETGRMHQIRVHMAYIGHPVIGDQKYGTVKSLVCMKKKYQILNDYLCFNRQALHASMLQIFHPITGVVMQWETSLPEDMIDLLNKLRLM